MPRRVVRGMASSLAFNGSSTNVSVPQVSGLPIYRTTGYSVTAWFKVNSFASSRVIFGEGNTTNGTPLLSIDVAQTNDNRIGVYLRNAGGNVFLNNLKAATRAKLGQWMHLAWVDVNGNCSLYIDGVLDATNFNYTPSGTFGFNTSTFGAVTRAATTGFMSGNMDEAQLFSYGLTASDIQAVIDGSLMGNVISYRLNETSGTVAMDYSGNNNNGVVANGTFSTDVPMAQRQITDRSFGRDLVVRPTFSGVGPVADSWVSYSSGGAGSFALADGVQTITATALTTGNRRWGMNGGTKGLHAVINKGEAVEITVESDLSGLDPTTNFQVYFEPKLGNEPADSFPTFNVGNGVWKTTWIASKNFTRLQPYVWIQSPTSWTGTSVAKITRVSIMKVDPYEKLRREPGELIYNGRFEFAPSGTVGTTAGNRWIDGSAIGSLTESKFGWATGFFAGTFSASIKNGTLELLGLSAGANISAFTRGLNDNILQAFGKTKINVTPGASYVLSAMMRTEYFSGDSAGAFVSLAFSDANGNSVGAVTSTLPVKTTTDWTKYVATTAVAPAGAVYAQVYPRISGSVGAGTLMMNAWFDEVSLRRTDSVADRVVVS